MVCEGHHTDGTSLKHSALSGLKIFPCTNWGSRVAVACPTKQCQPSPGMVTRGPAAEEVCFVLSRGTGSACRGSSLSLERGGPHGAWRCQGRPPSSYPSQRTKGFIQLLTAQMYSVSTPVLPLVVMSGPHQIPRVFLASLYQSCSLTSS